MSFYLRQPLAKYRLQVGVMSDLSDPTTFVPVATVNNSTTGVEPVSVDFSGYTGGGHYIAFRNVLASGTSGDYSVNYIDDVTLSQTVIYTIAVIANPTTGGSVTGAGGFASGSTCTLTATPVEGYSFVNWTEGSTVVSTNETYTFSVSSNRTLSANFEPVNNCGIAVTDLPYTENFDTYTSSSTPKTGVEPPCWTLAHQDVAMSDANKPTIYYKSAYMPTVGATVSC